MNCGRDIVLIVEDDADIREAVRDLLEDYGYTVLEAANGKEALQLLADGAHPCVILLDLMMPVMSGWEFRSLQLQRPELAAIPIIVVSADRSTAEKAAAISAAGYLEKPIRADALMSMVSRHCGTCAPLS